MKVDLLSSPDQLLESKHWLKTSPSTEGIGRRTEKDLRCERRHPKKLVNEQEVSLKEKVNHDIVCKICLCAVVRVDIFSPRNSE
jgi:hypothetical protein